MKTNVRLWVAFATFLACCRLAVADPTPEAKVWLSDKEPASCLARYLYDNLFRKDYGPPQVVSHNGSRVNGIIEHGATPATQYAYRRILERNDQYTITLSTLKSDMSGELLRMSLLPKQCSNPYILVSCNLMTARENFTPIIWDRKTQRCKPPHSYASGLRSRCPIAKDLCEAVERFHAGK